jgi:hypothetical protein
MKKKSVKLIIEYYIFIISNAIKYKKYFIPRLKRATAVLWSVNINQSQLSNSIQMNFVNYIYYKMGF